MGRGKKTNKPVLIKNKGTEGPIRGRTREEASDIKDRDDSSRASTLYTSCAKADWCNLLNLANYLISLHQINDCMRVQNKHTSTL